MTITPILWTWDILEDGTHALKIRYSYVKDKKKIRRYFPLNIYLKKNQWDEKKGKVIIGKHPNDREINTRLFNIETAIERQRLIEPGCDLESFITEVITPGASVNSDLISFFDRYIELCRAGEILHHKTKQKLSNGYIKSVGVVRSRIKHYAKAKRITSITFNDVTESFHDKLLHYLRYDYPYKDQLGLKENTLGKTSSILITVMRYAMKKKLHSNVAFLEFNVIANEVDNIALTEDEVAAIMNVDLSNKTFQHLIPEQQRFSIAYNFLLRFSDSILINQKNIFKHKKKYFFRMTTSKTKEEVVIPIMNRNYEILKSNNFTMPPSSNKQSNINLKKLGEIAGVVDNYTVTEFRKGKLVSTTFKRFELITTHTTRRSAATNLYLAGMDLNKIRMLGGWKSIKMLETYLKIEKLQNAKDVANHPFFK